ncbi:rhombosortase [Alteromonas sp. ASW11-36]|uniref:Rhombosortase n=1 Tax=Alteromonas arenosi TaxID=3055817 RepID=A0ABT7SYZ1_9ALTE|nr:rhombosortase [Alteromonas sp. ASW11-36]MDM7860762.1 rhombosortase [Alteromonas sp. ASW11-36]
MNMFTFPTLIRYWILPFFIILCSLLGFLLEPHSSVWFALKPPSFALETSFTLLTGHLLHTNSWHLLLNILGFGLLWALHGEYYYPRQFAVVWLLLSVATSICILAFDNVAQYVGLSGVLHGVFVWGACLDIKRGESTGWLLLLGVGIKIVYEQWFDDAASMAALIDAAVAVNAHLYGAIAGLIIGVMQIALAPSKATQVSRH